MIKLPRPSLAGWSTFGQMALMIIAALVVAQVIGFFLIRSIFDQWQDSYAEQAAVRKFAEAARAVASVPAGERRTVLSDLSRPGEGLWQADEAHFVPFRRQKSLETVLRQALVRQNVTVRDVQVYRRGPHGFQWSLFGLPPLPETHELGPRPRESQELATPQDAFERRGEPSRPREFDGGPPEGGGGDLRLAVQWRDGSWLIGRFYVQPPLPRILNPLVMSQIALFVVLLAATLFWASRIARPLRRLARKAEVWQPQSGFEPLPISGPRDVRVAVTAFNAMAERVRDLLAEKDRMLSAIGHDLRTPLASLRIRAESIEPDGERDGFIATLDEMTAMVEEILGLARISHSTEAHQLVDLTALADALVEEFHDQGKDVTFLDSPRAPLSMQVGLVRRLLRNLIDNALQYGIRARLRVEVAADAVCLMIEDDGPGIPSDKLQDVMQPFTRLEQSRSRLTGGSGLGLAIADLIAKSQGATLVLQNREGGGLTALLRWPL